jgi:hypothetical protein
MVFCSFVSRSSDPSSVANSKNRYHNTMAALETLPNELIGRIFGLCPDLHTAVSLSAANRWLRGIWLRSAERYTFEIRISNIVAYEQAVDLAIAEERLEGQLGHSAAFTGDPPIQRYAARLLRNDELASCAAAAFRNWLDNQPPDSYRRKMTFSCPHTAYYILRKLVLAYRHPQAEFQSLLLETLRTSSLVTLETNDEMSLFIGYQADYDERMKHGIPMPEEDWPTDEEENLPEWDYADDVVHYATVDCRFGMGKLEPAMNSVFESA